MEDFSNITDLEEAMKLLREQVRLRNQMGGKLYFDVLNDECCQLGNRARELGGSYAEIADTIGRQNFR